MLVSLAFIIHSCSGFLYNIFFTGSLLQFPNNAGIAGGLLGGMVYIITSLSSFIISTVGKISNQADMGLRYTIGSILLLVIARLTVISYEQEQQIVSQG